MSAVQGTEQVVKDFRVVEKRAVRSGVSLWAAWSKAGAQSLPINPGVTREWAELLRTKRAGI